MYRFLILQASYSSILWNHGEATLSLPPPPLHLLIIFYSYLTHRHHPPVPFQAIPPPSSSSPPLTAAWLPVKLCAPKVQLSSQWPEFSDSATSLGQTLPGRVPDGGIWCVCVCVRCSLCSLAQGGQTHTHTHTRARLQRRELSQPRCCHFTYVCECVCVCVCSHSLRERERGRVQGAETLFSLLTRHFLQKWFSTDETFCSRTIFCPAIHFHWCILPIHAVLWTLKHCCTYKVYLWPFIHTKLYVWEMRKIFGKLRF